MNEKKFLEIIGMQIRKLRREKGLSIVKLAHNCNMSKLSILQIEKGRQNWTITSLLLILKALDVHFVDFFKNIASK